MTVTTMPLDGITVVSLEQAVAAPFATRQLADLGARVIKIERPDGGDFARRYDETVRGQASYFVWLNRSKESLTLDCKSAGGSEVLHRLLARADVFVQNLAPGAAARLGLDAATLSARYPRLVVCGISGYGTCGPWAERKAYDLLVQCETGLVSVTGSADAAAKAGISVADISAGMYAYSGILAALFTRLRTGVAPAVEVSLFDSMVEWMSQPLYYTAYGGTPPPRVGAQHATIAPYGPFTAADGAVVLLAVQNEREWESLCRNVLGEPGLVGDPRFATGSSRVAHREELNQIIAAWFATVSAPDAVAALDGAAIATARLRSPAEVLDHPVLTGRDRWRPIQTPGGAVDVVLPPPTLSGVMPPMGPVPALGQHSEAILAELGYPAEAISALRERGVI